MACKIIVLRLKNTCLKKLRRLYPTGLIIPAAYLRSLVQGVPNWEITVHRLKEAHTASQSTMT